EGVHAHHLLARAIFFINQADPDIPENVTACFQIPVVIITTTPHHDAVDTNGGFDCTKPCDRLLSFFRPKPELKRHRQSQARLALIPADTDFVTEPPP